MQRSFIICCIFSLLAISCTEKNTTQEESAEHELKNKLSTSLVNNPRSLSDTQNSNIELGKLTFKDTLHDFGKIKEGEIVEYDFEYTNSGKLDLLIYEAKGSCGCTIPEYSSKPIKPKETGFIKVKFNSEGKHGFNDKSVGIKTNGEPSVYQLIIEAEVD